VFNHRLGRVESLVLLTLLFVCVIFSLYISRKQMKANREDIPAPRMKISVSVILIVLSSAGLVAGSDLLVKNAAVIAHEFGISERAISITLLAVGTSLPELVTSVMAAIQKETDISVGNIIGSNIFNILSVLGITAMIKPIHISQIMVNMDILWMLGISLLLFLLLIPLRKAILSRFDGLILLLIYVFYIYLVFRVG
ncbi:MAG TPA: sodium:calcium antiporter, partial [Bacteroidales bacterium]|nr:sodium:calcium antiporter [Bacteroidales bacterium]